MCKCSLEDGHRTLQETSTWAIYFFTQKFLTKIFLISESALTVGSSGSSNSDPVEVLVPRHFEVDPPSKDWESLVFWIPSELTMFGRPCRAHRSPSSS